MQLRSRILILCVLLVSSMQSSFAGDDVTDTEWSKERKLWTSSAVGSAFLLAWGSYYWDYWHRSPHFRSESWFDRDTMHGGADKIGHAYAVYGISHMLSHYYEKWGYSQQQAARNGAWSALFMHTIMELGDSFSAFGFSYQDYAMNVAGAYLGYYLYRHPDRNRYLDLRVEYIPTFSKNDIFTDYHGIKYMVALKLDAFESLRNTPLKHFELHSGYYVKGYEKVEHARERNVYAALGVNMLRLFGQSAKRGVRPKLLSYYQVPYTYVSLVSDLND